MENAQTPDEGKKTVKPPVTKPAASTRKPAAARAAQAKSATAKPASSSPRKPAAKKPAVPKAPSTPDTPGEPTSPTVKPTARRTASPKTSVRTPNVSKATAPKSSAPPKAGTKQARPTTSVVYSEDVAWQNPAAAGTTPESEPVIAEAAADVAVDAEAETGTRTEAVTPVVETEPTKAASTESVSKPDAVLAGLARLRALAAQFTVSTPTSLPTFAPTVEVASEPNAADAAVDEAVAADREAEVIPEPMPAATPEQAFSTTLPPVPELIPESAPEAEDELELEPAPETEAEDEAEFESEPQLEPEPEPEPAAEAVVVLRPTLTHALDVTSGQIVLKVRGLSKDYGDTVAVNDIDLNVRAGVFYGIVGPNGAGKTTTLSMITGLLRPDSGTASVNGIDVWDSPEIAKRSIGVLPDRLRIFDRLTGSQLLYYSGVLRGLKAAEVRKRSADLATAFGLDDVMGRLVSDYSSGMLKKVALAAAMIHSPRLLVLDEPFESVDPVSAATVTRILKQYVNAGGTVLLSSHRMELVQRVCSHVAVIVEGTLLADGTIDEVRNGMSLEDRFVQLTGKNSSGGGLEWLSSFSD